MTPTHCSQCGRELVIRNVKPIPKYDPETGERCAPRQRVQCPRIGRWFGAFHDYYDFREVDRIIGAHWSKGGWA